MVLSFTVLYYTVCIRHTGLRDRRARADSRADCDEPVRDQVPPDAARGPGDPQLVRLRVRRARPARGGHGEHAFSGERYIIKILKPTRNITKWLLKLLFLLNAFSLSLNKPLYLVNKIVLY